MAGVEGDQHAGRLVIAVVLNRVAESRRNEADIPSVERLLPPTAVRAEQGDAHPSGDDVLPFVGIGMPVQLAQAARIEVENHAGNGSRDGKAVLADAPLSAARMDGMRRLLQQTELVRVGR